MNNSDQRKYDAAREAAHNYFQKNKRLHSPVLDMVYFNSDGFMHLSYEDRYLKQKRGRKNQLMRFQILQYTRKIIEGMSFYQEYLEQYQIVMMKHKKHRVPENKLVKYWGFIAIINDKIRVKLILRKVGEGHIHFWSIIPIWKIRYYKGVKYADLSTGNLEND